MYRMDDTECPAYALNNIKNWGREAYTVWYFVPADIKKIIDFTEFLHLCSSTSTIASF